LKPAAAVNLALSFKSLWGASTIPFCPGAQPAFAPPQFEALAARIEQLCALGSSGVLYGPNGSGKSYLLNYLLQNRLTDKQFKSLVLTHSSLSGSDLLRALCLKLEIEPKFRRSDNVALITQSWKSFQPRWPLVVLEEAQNLSAVALEELRLLSCARLDTVPFSLLLVGDPSLLGKLKLGVHAPLRSRLGYCLELTPFDPALAQQYIEHSLRSASIHLNPFEPEALQLLIQASGGLARTINHLAQRALESAALENSPTVASLHVQTAIDRLPWLVHLLPAKA
jgi:type II secretory pathway predicted ATPase ExeA